MRPGLTLKQNVSRRTNSWATDHAVFYLTPPPDGLPRGHGRSAGRGSIEERRPSCSIIRGLENHDGEFWTTNLAPCFEVTRESRRKGDSPTGTHAYSLYSGKRYSASCGSSG